MNLRINLYGDIFRHNLINGKISSTQGKEPKHITYVNDESGEINLFIDRSIYDVRKIDNGKKNFGWLMESRAVAPELEDILIDKENILNEFENIFTYNKKLIDEDKRFKFLFPSGYWVEEFKNFKKTKLISMVLSDKKFTSQQKARNKFAKKYKNQIDIFGSGHHYLYKKEIGLLNYKFSIVFENDIFDDYFTEKILDCFATKTIPIYSGTKNIVNYFDEEGIIFLDDFKISEIDSNLYENKFKAVENNYIKVKEFKLPEDKLYNDYLKSFKNNNV